MSTEEFYNRMGSGWNDVLHRLGSEARILKILAMLLRDQSMAQLTQALESQDYSAAFRAAHTLKGIALNLSLDRLAQSASTMTEALRSQQYNDDIFPCYDQLHGCYQETTEAIRLLLGISEAGETHG